MVQRASKNPKLKNHQLFGKEFLSNLGYNDFIQGSCEFHHEKDLQDLRQIDTPLWKKNIYEILCESDNLSSGERRQEGGFSPSRPLESIFCRIGSQEKSKIYPNLSPFSKIYEYAPYSRLKSKLTFFPNEKGMEKLRLKSETLLELAEVLNLTKEYGLESNPDIILKILEEFTTFIPSSTQESRPDISLFDHLKTTSAIAKCMYEVLVEDKEFNSKSFEKIAKNRKNTRFLLIGLDVSGIQKFITHVPSKGALRFLKTKSTFVEILLMDIISEILLRNKMGWANVVYCSGGNGYILAPNTKKTIDILNTIKIELQTILFEKFQTQIYVAVDMVELQGLDFFENEGNSLLRKWELLTKKLGEQKRRKFENIIKNHPYDLFAQNPTLYSVEKCEFCNQIFPLNKIKQTSYFEAESWICQTCLDLLKLSRIIKDTNWVSLHSKNNIDRKDLSSEKKLISGIFSDWVFHQNLAGSESSHSKKYCDSMKGIWAYNNQWDCKNSIKELGEHLSLCNFSTKKKEQLLFTTINVISYPDKSIFVSDDVTLDLDWYAQNGLGSKRLGILAMDIDSLGYIFFKGLIEKNVSFSRIATLSRFFDIFFKQMILSIIRRQEIPSSKINLFCDNQKNSPYLAGRDNLGETTALPRKIELIYSGGDDLLLIGSWNDVFEVMFDIQTCFNQFVCQNPHITISAGLYVGSARFPIAKSFIIAHELLDEAKRNQECCTMQKNAVSLFTKSIKQDYTTWDDYRKIIAKFLPNLIRFPPNQSPKLKINKSWLRHIYDILTSISIANKSVFTEENYRYMKFIALVYLFGMKSRKELERDKIKELVLHDVKDDHEKDYLNSYIIADLLTRGK